MVGVTLSLGSPANCLKRVVFPTALSPSRSILHFCGLLLRSMVGCIVNVNNIVSLLINGNVIQRVCGIC